MRIEKISEQNTDEIRKDGWSLHKEAVRESIVQANDSQPSLRVVIVAAFLHVTGSQIRSSAEHDSKGGGIRML